MQRDLRHARRRRAGQAMIEYVLALLALLAVASAAGWLVLGVRARSERSLDLVSSEYP